MEQYNSYYILPSNKRLVSHCYDYKNDDKREEIIRYYDTIIIEPYAKKYCEKIFGKDISVVIMTYYGNGNCIQEEEKKISIHPTES